MPNFLDVYSNVEKKSSPPNNLLMNLNLHFHCRYYANLHLKTICRLLEDYGVMIHNLSKRRTTLRDQPSCQGVDKELY